MKTLLFVISLLLLHSLASAEVYEWVDEKGQKHFQDHPRDTPEGGISIDEEHVEKADTLKQENQKRLEVIKEMENARKQRQKERHKALIKQRKQDEKCLKLQSQVHKLESRMQKHYREFSNDRSPAYERQQAELAERKKFMEQYCN